MSLWTSLSLPHLTFLPLSEHKRTHSGLNVSSWVHFFPRLSLCRCRRRRRRSLNDVSTGRELREKRGKSGSLGLYMCPRLTQRAFADAAALLLLSGARVCVQATDCRRDDGDIIRVCLRGK